MYLDHFGLNEAPFRITPHTDFFFDVADRGATLTALVYTILHDEGIVKVCGEVGSGKTMLCRVLMERLPQQVETIYLTNPSLERDEILYAIADDLRLSLAQGRITVALRAIEEHLIGLYAQGRRVVILIDEAHAMPEATLEQVRLLSNLESNRHKLLQIVLFGQPELDGALDKASMRQIKDRITHSFRMRPLSEEEVGRYISFRMRAAGYRGPDVFSSKSVKLIAKASGGLTRRVNILADKSLLAAFTDNTHAITQKQVRTAVRDSEFGRLLNQDSRNPLVFAGAALALGLVLGVAAQWALTRSDTASAPALAQTTPQTAPLAKPAAAPQPATEPAAALAASAPAPAAAAAQATPPLPPPAATPAAVSAVRTVPTAAPQASLPAGEAAKRMSKYSAGNNRLLRERIAATLERVEREPDHSYTIELFVTENSDPARMQRFLLRARDVVPIEEVFVLPHGKPEHYRIRVTYGAYADRENAAKAAERLPPKYKQAFQPELRSFAELRRSL